MLSETRSIGSLGRVVRRTSRKAMNDGIKTHTPASNSLSSRVIVRMLDLDLVSEGMTCLDCHQWLTVAGGVFRSHLVPDQLLVASSVLRRFLSPPNCLSQP